jgi:HD superfamily phosphohydrolase
MSCGSVCGRHVPLLLAQLVVLCWIWCDNSFNIIWCDNSFNIVVYFCVIGIALPLVYARSIVFTTSTATSTATSTTATRHWVCAGLSSLPLVEGKPTYVRDVLYEYVAISPLAKRFIDTPEFQSLRDLKQLGLASYVFPSCNHTRLEHSLGVYHLAGMVMRSIQKSSPHLFSPYRPLSERLIELVQLAGLLHDCGHLAASHAFDMHVAKALGLPDHEERGVTLVKEIVHKYAIPLTKNEVDFICGLIVGSPDVKPAWVRSIIHDRESEVDCDKWDYLVRDSYYLGFGKPIQVARLLNHIRVLPIPIVQDQKDDKQQQQQQREEDRLRICFSRKTFWQVCDIFQTRYRLFREVYRHRVVVSVDEMIAELFRILVPVFKMWLAAGLRPTDSTISALPHWMMFLPQNIMSEKDRARALELWQRLKTRRHYRASQVPESAAGDIHVRLGLSALADDPVEKVWFYDDRSRLSHLKVEEVTKLLGASPRVANETIFYRLHKD